MKNLLIIAIAIALVQCEPVIPQNNTPKKLIVFDNYEYESGIGNVKILPVINGKTDLLGNPVINLLNNEYLTIDFDLLTDQFENLSAKIYHCNKDWSKSSLRDMEFLEEINYFRITEFDYSLNTIQPYINYRFTLPRPKISGNYVLAISRRSNPNDLLFTRKFIAYEPSIAISELVRVSTTVNKREQNQQIEFSISYSDLLVNSPTQDVKPIILQNHNWSTAINDIQPTLIRANEGLIEYKNFDLSTNFDGWNEYRWTDLRTLSIAGRNVSKISRTENEILAQLGMDESRAMERYSQNFQDINGNYLIQNNDPGRSLLNADYAKTFFYLKQDRLNGEIYITGRFNNWRLESTNLLRFDENLKVYSTDLYLKQGYYDYTYVVISDQHPTHYLEGNHFQTENDYEILVYYRRPGQINDEILGYKKFKSIADF